MPISSQLHTASPSQPFADLAFPPLPSAPTITDVVHPQRDKALRIVSVLQTTLEIDEVIALFSREIAPLISHHGICYINQPQDIEFNIGGEGAQTCTYQLSFAEQSLGFIIFKRHSAFDKQEKGLIEYLLSTLIYPLRNALHYHDALRAALRDPLTGIGNRSAMDSSVVREIQLAKRNNTPLSLIALDIDHFKNINDNWGHSIGDCAIKTLVKSVKSCMRSSDMLFRYGGEEFTALLHNTDVDGALLLAERIRATVEATPCACGDNQILFTISMGVASMDSADDSLALFNRADVALYQAKNSGRNCVRCADSGSNAA
ncbi:MAG: GGDEF domain-containing protein [Gammaproteobacteria bacterium]|nr:GGDEF domain-containing protein [Gammaproteobacteria bacterium]